MDNNLPVQSQVTLIGTKGMASHVRDFIVSFCGAKLVNGSWAAKGEKAVKAQRYIDDIAKDLTQQADARKAYIAANPPKPRYFGGDEACTDLELGERKGLAHELRPMTLEID